MHDISTIKFVIADADGGGWGHEFLCVVLKSLSNRFVSKPRPTFSLRVSKGADHTSHAVLNPLTTPCYFLYSLLRLKVVCWQKEFFLKNKKMYLKTPKKASLPNAKMMFTG